MSPSDSRLAEEAAMWIVRLSASDPLERTAAQQGLDAWMQRSPAHAAAAARMRSIVERVHGMAGTPPARAGIDAALNHAKRGRTRRPAVAAVTALLLSVAIWAGLQAYPVSYMTADMRTATGHWATRTLEDGTRITLGTGTAVNLRYDPRRRVLELLQGQILVDVAKDHERPFVIETRQGRVTALGTRFIVDSRPDLTILTMIESRVQVDAADGSSAVVQAGERVGIRASGIERLGTVDPRAVSNAWAAHQLVVRNQPLADVLDELNRHRPGRIFYDRAALEGVSMAVVLPLDDTDSALKLLAASVPGLTVRSLSPYLTWVTRRQ